MTDLKIIVVGSGVIGVTTANELLNSFNNVEVTILADQFYEDTCSWVAAGLFRPGIGFIGPDAKTTQKWINDSYHYWKNIHDNSYGADVGVAEISGYIFSNQHKSIVRNPYIEKLLPIYRKATEKELTTLCPETWKYGSFLTTLVTDSSIYLPWATNKFKSSGGKIVQRHVKRLESLGHEYDIIVNCTGMGAKYLCKDNKMVPIRGQVIKVDAPWMKTFYYGELDTYVIPGLRYVTLGGCRNYDSYNTKPDKFDALSIRERCEKLVPSIKSAKEVNHLVGLRPYRSTVRVEKEVLVTTADKKIKIVHNYGHGGYGVTTAPGTSLYACQLVKELWSGNSKL
ncbi:D-aspartate oxidase [Diorhabda carinulata]|uniref:D-aspartate oxidase n=1 Tax=Diorhabda carinulata TaxID=1163345 RepID=UPI0025A1803E|nr:D-aspartate oxidase [Diorhabda carinulata]